MAHNPPIEIRSLLKKGTLDEDRFYRLLSEQNNYVDPKTVKDFYLGLVRLLSHELRENGVVHLPHLGYFALVKRKDSIGWVGQHRQFLSGKYTLKFYAHESWRQYFSKMQGTPGFKGALDPREKLLNKDL
jgi:nucleoid DNA-binding protein